MHNVLPKAITNTTHPHHPIFAFDNLHSPPSVIQTFSCITITDFPGLQARIYPHDDLLCALRQKFWQRRESTAAQTKRTTNQRVARSFADIETTAKPASVPQKRASKCLVMIATAEISNMATAESRSTGKVYQDGVPEQRHECISALAYRLFFSAAVIPFLAS